MSGSTHFLLDCRTGWRSGRLTNLDAGFARLELAEVPGTAQPLNDPFGTFGGLSEPTGVAVDTDGTIYVLDGQASLVKRYDPCTGTFDVLQCLGGPGTEPRRLQDAHGLAVTPRGDLFVADSGNRRVQVFSLKGLALRAVWGPFKVAGTTVEPAASDDPDAWEPWDVAVGPDRCAYVSDRHNGVVLRIGSSGDVLAVYPPEGAARLDRPTAIALDPDGRLYVVEEGQAAIAVFGRGGEREATVDSPADVARRFVPVAIAVDDAGRLYVADRGGHCVWRFDCCIGVWDGCVERFRGSATALAYDLHGNLLVGDASAAKVLELPLHGAFQTTGTYLSQPLDSRIDRCEWHSVELEAAIPKSCRVRVETFTSQAEKTLEEVETLPAERWSRAQVAAAGADDWDCLVQSAPGRYLWLRLTLEGSGAAGPAVARVKVRYPRNSSLRFLPAVFGDDPLNRDFIARFLSIFDRVHRRTTHTLDEMPALLDPRSAAATATRAGELDFLAWLGGWMGMALDRSWPERRRRQLVARAYELYRLRGTPAGMRLAIELYTGLTPRLLEHFRLRRWLFADAARLGQQSVLWGEAIVRRLQLDAYARIGDFQLVDSGDPLHDPFLAHAHQFTVVVPIRNGGTEAQRRLLEQIVELAKPAYTKANVAIVEPRFRIGMQSLLGIDSIVGEYPAGVVEGDAELGHGTVLGPSPDESDPPTLRVGVRARIGSSTLID